MLSRLEFLPIFLWEMLRYYSITLNLWKKIKGLGCPIKTLKSIHFDCFIAQAGWPQAKHRWGLILVCTTQEIPGPVHSVDSYRPHWNSILTLHS